MALLQFHNRGLFEKEQPVYRVVGFHPSKLPIIDGITLSLGKEVVILPRGGYCVFKSVFHQIFSLYSEETK